jgi:hypothetical protein
MPTFGVENSTARPMRLAQLAQQRTPTSRLSMCRLNNKECGIAVAARCRSNRKKKLDPRGRFARTKRTAHDVGLEHARPRANLLKKN